MARYVIEDDGKHYLYDEGTGFYKEVVFKADILPTPSLIKKTVEYLKDKEKQSL
jgi:hypothetical protein